MMGNRYQRHISMGGSGVLSLSHQWEGRVRSAAGRPAQL